MTQLFTDTSANLPVEIIDEYGIEVVPFSYTIDGVEYIPEREFDGKAFYAAMRAGSEVKTSMVNASRPRSTRERMCCISACPAA